MRSTYVGLIALSLAAAALGGGCAAENRPGLVRGRELYETCVPCHGQNGGGSLDLRVPAIAGLPEWYVKASLDKYMKDIRGAHPDDLDGHRMRPMARTLSRNDDATSVAAYVAGMAPVAAPATFQADPAAGEATYTSICATCHGERGEGNEGMGSPPIARQADWYMVAQLVKFQNGMRGAHPEDVAGAQMAAMSLTLADTTAMRDVVAFIRSLPD